MNPMTKPIEKNVLVNTSKLNKGMFETWQFPDYEYVEYPKWIGEGANRKLVRDKREEIIARGENPELAGESENPVVRENADLKKQLADMQAQVDTLLKAAQPSVEPPKDPKPSVPLKKV